MVFKKNDIRSPHSRDTKYLAFISYSSKDGVFAKSLHSALERTSYPDSKWWAPKKLRPIFRDRNELRAGNDLPRLIKEALAESTALVVVCSNNAVMSQWVNAEIDYFCSLGRRDRTFLFVIGSSRANNDEFIPMTLRAGSVPLFADARKGKDGWSLAVSKIAAGLINVRLDAIWKRHKRDKVRSLTWKCAAVAILCLLSLVTCDQYVVSSSKRLAREAELLASTKIDLALLLSVEAYNIFPTDEAGVAIRNVLSFSPHLSNILYSSEPVTKVAYSPKNDLILSGDSAGALTFWDIKAPGLPGRRVQAHSGPVTSLLFNRDGRRIVSADRKGSILIWDFPFETSNNLSIPGADEICCISLHPDGKTLAVGIGEEISFWDIEKRQPLLPSITTLKEDVTSLAFGKIAGEVLASGGEKVVQIWRTSNRQVAESAGLYKGELPVPDFWRNMDNPPTVSTFDFSKWGTLAVSWSNGTVHLWLVSDFKPRDVRLGAISSDPVIQFSPKEEILAGSNRENGITLWNLTSRGGPIIRLRGPSTPVRDLSFSPEGHRLVASGDRDIRIMIWTFNERTFDREDCSQVLVARDVAGRRMKASERADYMPLLPTSLYRFARIGFRPNEC